MELTSPASSAQTIKTSASYRVVSIDLLRGIVMIIMALDHVRDFFHYNAAINQDPLDFATTTPLLFLTRFITHFCAPVFVFLTGTGIFLFGSKGKTKKQVSYFLLTRGLWLMLAEIFIITPLWDFNFTFIGLQVIWAIGLSMVTMSVLIFLPYRLLFALGVLIIVGHNFLDSVTNNNDDVPSFLWAVVHQLHIFSINKNLQVGLLYPFLSWLGLMIIGYSFGKLYLPGVNASYRKKFLRYAGVGAIALFIILRYINQYWDMHHWSLQKTTAFTLLDFVNTTKYPPSLLYMLMTVGPALIFLSFAENGLNRISKKILIYGKVPFFYYILHVFLIHALAWIAFFATGHSWSNLDFTHFRNGSLPFASGYPLWFVYTVWATVVVLLYFPCRWFSRYKATHKQWWLGYL